MLHNNISKITVDVHVGKRKKMPYPEFLDADDLKLDEKTKNEIGVYLEFHTEKPAKGNRNKAAGKSRNKISAQAANDLWDQQYKAIVSSWPNATDIKNFLTSPKYLFFCAVQKTQKGALLSRVWKEVLKDDFQRFFNSDNVSIVDKHTVIVSLLDKIVRGQVVSLVTVFYNDYIKNLIDYIHAIEDMLSATINEDDFEDNDLISEEIKLACHHNYSEFQELVKTYEDIIKLLLPTCLRIKNDPNKYKLISGYLIKNKNFTAIVKKFDKSNIEKSLQEAKLVNQKRNSKKRPKTNEDFEDSDEIDAEDSNETIQQLPDVEVDQEPAVYHLRKRIKAPIEIETPVEENNTEALQPPRKKRKKSTTNLNKITASASDGIEISSQTLISNSAEKPQAVMKPINISHQQNMTSPKRASTGFINTRLRAKKATPTVDTINTSCYNCYDKNHIAELEKIDEYTYTETYHDSKGRELFSAEKLQDAISKKVPLHTNLQTTQVKYLHKLRNENLAHQPGAKGLYAANSFKKNTYLGYFTGQLVPKSNSHYSWNATIDNNELMIDCTKYGNVLRYPNSNEAGHNIIAELITVKIDGENYPVILYKAIRDILPGEQFIINYGTSFNIPNRQYLTPNDNELSPKENYARNQKNYKKSAVAELLTADDAKALGITGDYILTPEILNKSNKAILSTVNQGNNSTLYIDSPIYSCEDSSDGEALSKQQPLINSTIFFCYTIKSDKELSKLNLLINNGSTIDFQNSLNGQTAIFYAARNPYLSDGKKAELVQLLINSGANIGLQDANGKSVFDWCLQENNFETFSVLQNSLLNNSDISDYAKKSLILNAIKTYFSEPLNQQFDPLALIEIIRVMEFNELSDQGSMTEENNFSDDSDSEDSEMDLNSDHPEEEKVINFKVELVKLCRNLSTISCKTENSRRRHNFTFSHQNRSFKLSLTDDEFKEFEPNSPDLTQGIKRNNS